MRYTDKRKREVAARNASGWLANHRPAPVVKSTVQHVRVPIRLDHKTVAYVRESNLDRYLDYFPTPACMENHLRRFYADPENFLV